MEQYTERADEMFEELGCKKQERYTGEQYINPTQNLKFYFKNTNILEIWEDDNFIQLSVQELQAINEKVKELGWSEEK